MKRLLMGIIAVLLGISLAACGSGGGATGNGNTVFISANIKSGTTGAVFANFSGVVFKNHSSVLTSANPMNFTVKSTVYNVTGTIPNSDVLINNMTFTFTPMNGAPVFTPSVSSVPYSGLITPNGSIDISNVPILWDIDVQNIKVAAGSSKGQFQYNVGVTFHGVEVNTGQALSAPINVSAFVQIK